VVDDISKGRRKAAVEPPPFTEATIAPAEAGDEPTIVQLHEERLEAHKETRSTGEVEIRTTVEETPARLEVDAVREDVEVEHVPVGRTVSAREQPRQEGDTLIVPVYEEQLVVSKRLVLREELHIRRVAVTEHRLFEDTLRREKLIIDDFTEDGVVHERFPEEGQAADEGHEGFLGSLKRKMMTP